MSLYALARFARAARTSAEERCELCAAPIGPQHGHVVDLASRRLSCACRPCALLFTDAAAAGGRYRTVPDRVRVDPDLAIDDETWQRVGVPVRLAFFVYASSLARWTAWYPSPAGATEAEVSDDESMTELGPLTRVIEPDVEALLVRRSRGSKAADVFLVPVDACYELVARVRSHWRGFDGGDDANRAIDTFFDALRMRARPLERGGER